MDSVTQGWIVGNGDQTKWRMWDGEGPRWVTDRNNATRYARRCDAESVHAEDEDAWSVVPYATRPDNRAELEAALREARERIFCLGDHDWDLHLKIAVALGEQPRAALEKETGRADG